MAEEDVEVSGLLDKWVKLEPSGPECNLSGVTRAKVANELVLPLGRRRGGPCLRKLVLWTNLLGASLSGAGGGAAPSPAPSPGPTTVSSSQAEHDWFESVMEEIDDSDSDSGSGSEAGLDTPGLCKRPRSPSEDHDWARPRGGPTQRARRLCMALRGRRLLRRRRRQAARRLRGLCCHPPPVTIPSLLIPPPLPTPAQPTRSTTHTTPLPTNPPSLSSLLPTKTSFRFDPEPSSPSPSTSKHPATHLPNAIDFSIYEFLITTDDQRSGLKYLVGLSTVRRRLVVTKVRMAVSIEATTREDQHQQSKSWKVFGLSGIALS